MEDIPDITSDMLGRLRKLNINSVYQLAVQIPSELAFEIGDAIIDIESAAKLIGNARKILTDNEVLSKEFLTADDMLEKRNEISRYSTGSSNFDTLLTTHGHVNKKKWSESC
jgi:RecA/RadA recombinase